MWIFLIELIGYSEDTPDYPKTILTVGNAPAEDSKPAESEDLQFETESDEDGIDEDEDEFDEDFLEED